MLKAISPYPRRVISVLHISAIEEDHRSLEEIFRHTNWLLHKAYGLSSAKECLKDVPVSVILCDGDLKTGNWKDLLTEVSDLPAPQPLIVTSRLADHGLWGEVLNLGGHDLLAKPFELSEVVQAVHLAWCHWSRQSELAPRPPASVHGSQPLQRSDAMGAA